MMYKLLNYGKPYTNYNTYKLIPNDDNIDIIYVADLFEEDYPGGA